MQIILITSSSLFIIGPLFLSNNSLSKYAKKNFEMIYNQFDSLAFDNQQ